MVLKGLVSQPKGACTRVTYSLRAVTDSLRPSAAQFPNNRCLGWRPWNTTTKTWDDYTWEDFNTTRIRRENIGKGLVDMHKSLGVGGTQYGIGLWSQNRPEWQLTGTPSFADRVGPRLTISRSRMHVSIFVQRFTLRNLGSRHYRVHYQSRLVTLCGHVAEPRSRPHQA